MLRIEYMRRVLVGGSGSATSGRSTPTTLRFVLGESAMESFSQMTKTSAGVKRQRWKGSRRSKLEKYKTITWLVSRNRSKRWDSPQSERPSRQFGKARRAELSPAEPSRGVPPKGSLAQWASTIRVRPSSRRSHTGPSRRTGPGAMEMETDQGLGELRVSARTRFRDARSARTSGVTSARRCAAPSVEVWDALLAENARNAERTPQPALSVVLGLAGCASFVVSVVSGRLFIVKTVTVCQPGPESAPARAPGDRRREPKP